MEVFLDVMNGASKVIVATEGDNNSRQVKIVLTENNSRINLADKRLRMVMILSNSNEGKVIDELTITNFKNGEIELLVSKELTEKDGLFNCQIEVAGVEEYLRYTECFNMVIKENLFKNLFIKG